MQYLLATVLLALAAVGQAQIISVGKCPDVKVQQTFQVQPYLGRWFELSSFPNFFQRNQRCGQAFYRLKDDGNVFVNNTNYKLSGEVESISGEARIDDPAKKEGKLGVRFSSFQPWGKYWVLQTDYTSFSLVYSCSNYIGLFKSEFLWVLTRAPTVSKTRIASIQSLLTGYGIKHEKMIQYDLGPQCVLTSV